ncbi:DET1- and DDB1-associated protein 1 [Nymphon striatum]|nr:DET1- and DDB1-associated protein 1 [Nymphon striatum]
MSVNEFLKELPSHNENNFKKFSPEAGYKTTVGRPSVYLPTEDKYPPGQIITTESTNILLRYLHQQWDKKNSQKKRDQTRANLTEEDSTRKRPKLDEDSVNFREHN